MSVIQVVVSADRKNLAIQFKDPATGLALDVTGWSARLQGRSKGPAGLTLDEAGVILGSPTDGTFKWSALGGSSYVTLAELGEMPSALFDAEVKLTDGAGKIDYGPRFQLEWLRPLVP